ncbi:MAG: CDF family Co(II)/Ni(II) efflux transporter DmeF [Desulfarculus sp.]|nr:CDF family Co(II)/Ni(II) efflux transporter DmeF [Pseudomonadota bacterium]MBV1718358.1 CDF family Co(II)/Ni(II) efflux transporter DmeF [Desulfarculus sp.]MBU4574732.1 CDF family Co(II)/Ni(II) efflux transporter DmeF [Pseudomonadota bacterium]MBU4596328.1 CDF family Co(II)/Ni(II) efflux transporter DmeF [Pseudomonadota bacterium]MBV1739626.1 CDF family Co(II)/Ni(II) efflux transporter DmeF [Desulfarculus sp.]
MNQEELKPYTHGHDFLGASQARHERRTHLVIALTAVMMVIEVTAGVIFGSMALLADGWHMASHAAALSITALGYWLARRHAADPRFCFGTGKVGELAGFASALLLGFIAVFMAYESVLRLVSPVTIAFNQAIWVAVIGLVVNLVSALMLKEEHHDHGHGHSHDHDEQEHGHSHDTDHNLKSAYMHVVADALTSVLAIVALSAGKFWGWVWLDPVMGIVGAVVIARWSWGLLRDTGRMLLDMNLSPELEQSIRRTLEQGGDKVSDLHLWRLGPGHLGAIVSIVSHDPQPNAAYRDKLAAFDQISHLTVEVHQRP